VNSLAQEISVDYFQREYRWQQKQITELVTDLLVRLPARPWAVRRRQVSGYFLDSIIVSGWIEDERY
jgi:uncharacterized protein with ParB-like and HNH nuclease domain